MSNGKLSYFMNKSKSLKDRNFDKTIKIALLSSYTINGFYETLKVKMSEHQIGGNIYVGAYNQYNQEILKDDSELYNFKPNLTFLMIDTRTILGEIFYSPYSISAEERKKNIEKKFLELKNLINIFLNKSNSNSSLLIYMYQHILLMDCMKQKLNMVFIL